MNLGIPPSSLIKDLSESIPENYREIYSNASTYRQQIILLHSLSTQENLTKLIKLFKETKLTQECQIFLIKVFRNIAGFHTNLCPLSEVTLLLAQINLEVISSMNVMIELANFIGFSTRLVFQNQTIFLFPISDDTNHLSPLQWISYYYIIEYMDNPGNDCNEIQNNEIVLLFKTKHFLPIFNVSFRAFASDSQIEYCVRLLHRCILFCRNHTFRNCFESDPITTHILSSIQDENIFQQFLHYASICPPPISSDIMHIVVDLLEISPTNDSSSGQLFTYIISFSTQIFQVTSFRPYPENVNVFRSIFSSFPNTPEVMLLCQEFAQNVLSFIIETFSTNYSFAFDFLFSAIKLFNNIYLYLSRESPLFDCFSNLLHVFIDSTLSKSDTNAQDVFQSLFINSQVRKRSKSLINFLLALSTEKSDEYITYIAETLMNMSGEPFTPILNLKIGFLIFICRLIFKVKSFDYRKPPNNLIFEACFQYFVMVNDSIEEYNKSLDIPYVAECSALFYLKSFMKMYLITKDFEKSIPVMEPFDSPKAVIIFLFQRFWKDTLNEICQWKSKKCLKVFLELGVKNRIIYDFIFSAGYPQEFLENYLAYPCRKFIYYTVICIMHLSPETRVQFFQSLENFFRTEKDLESLTKLFKMFSSGFCYTDDPRRWRTIYRYLHNHFLSICIEVSPNPAFFKSVSTLISKLVFTIPSSSPFSSKEPHRFLMTRNIMTICSNLLTSITPLLNEIPIDNSIYEKVFFADIIDSKPISLSETHKIGISDSKLKIQRTPMADTSKLQQTQFENWNKITLIIQIAKCMLSSSIPNFEIMEVYNDTCIFAFFEKLIEAISKTSLLSLIPNSHFMLELSEWLQIFVSNFSNVIMKTPIFSKFTLDFLRCAFLSNLNEVVNRCCHILCLLIQRFTNPEEIDMLKGHFVFAFNTALNMRGCTTAIEFVFEFTRIDPIFVSQIAQLIEQNLQNEFSRGVFHQSFCKLWEDLNLEKESTGNNRQKVMLIFNSFIDSITPHSIKLYVLPCFADYFDFKI